MTRGNLVLRQESGRMNEITSFATPPFSDFKRIAVVGCQRSGTRFVAFAIAKDLGYTLFDQHAIGISNWNIFNKKLDQAPCSIQATGCTHRIHDLKRDDVLVVWVRREVANILKSQVRINWCEGWEKNKIPRPYKEAKPLCVGRTRYWEEVQRLEVPCWVEVQYERLRGHPLFVPRETRWAVRGSRGFHSNQSELNPTPSPSRKRPIPCDTRFRTSAPRTPATASAPASAPVRDPRRGPLPCLRQADGDGRAATHRRCPR